MALLELNEDGEVIEDQWFLFKHELNAFFVALCLFEIVHTTLLSKSSEQPRAVVATKPSTPSTTRLRIMWLYRVRKQDLVRPHPQR